MKKWSLAILLFMLPAMAWANCDFCWNFETPMHVKPSRNASSLVYCGNVYGYVSKAQYDLLTRYQRADVNMILTIDGEYVDSPCIPDKR